MKTREWKMEDGMMAGSSRCDDRSAPRADPAHNAAARRGLRALPLPLVVGCSMLVVGCFSLVAQYSIDWHTIDGGGGTSTGAVYSVSGTIGQPDAGAVMTNGQYAVTGGFWAFAAAIQTPGAPWLSIFRTSTNTVIVSWPSLSTSWDLQQNTISVSSPNWSNVTDPIQDDGTTKTLIINPPAGNRFYRLKK